MYGCFFGTVVAVLISLCTVSVVSNLQVMEGEREDQESLGKFIWHQGGKDNHSYCVSSHAHEKPKIYFRRSFIFFPKAFCASEEGNKSRNNNSKLAHIPFSGTKKINSAQNDRGINHRPHEKEGGILSLTQRFRKAFGTI